MGMDSNSKKCINGGVLMHKIQKCIQDKRCGKYAQLLLITTMIALVDLFVYFTGGTNSSFPNMMYIPVILASFAFGIRKGLIFALLAGLTLGPLMPQDVNLGIMQPTISWLTRMGFYLIVSLIVSHLLNRINRLNKEIQDKAYENPVTGLPNVNKFLLDLEKHIKKDAHKSFTLLIFKYENMLQLSRCIDFFAGRKALNYLIDTATGCFPDNPIYSLHLEEFAVALPETDLIAAYEKGRLFLEQFERIHYVSNVPVHFDLKCGVINYPIHGATHRAFLQNMGRTMDQVENSNKNIAVFDGYLCEKNLRKYDILINFLKNLNEEMLTLNYQPKIDLKTNRVLGVEALLRWKDASNNYVRIDELINTIENAGVINKLTRWVVKKSIEQLSEWHKLGMNISVSVNLSSKDLCDNSLLKYTEKYIERYKVDPAYLEYELTERSLIANEGKSLAYLNELKNIGLKISIDDYGTGYNSLMNMLSLPIDYIKIDKYFIDNICDSQGRKLVQHMIFLVHNLDKKVFAEGVETIEQLEALIQIDCDYVQGYYYCKPIPADEIIIAVKEINNGFTHCIPEKKELVQ
jgi:EAL domain-containing protein (putative c-di-GMP-specific phosphodiesterase class I)/GGDEF domain-containing protein